MKNKKIRFGHWILSLFAVIIVSLLATVAVENSKAKAIMQAQMQIPESDDEEIVYGADGKTDGSQLATEPQQAFYEYIVYEDRVVERFYYREGKVQFTSLLLNQFYDWLPEDVNKHLMIVPSRVLVDGPDDIDDGAQQKLAITDIYNNISEDVSTIDVTGIMEDKKDEYIFFRTVKAWTALGAYYAAEEFLSTVDIDIVPIEEYNEYLLGGYVGTMVYLDGTESLHDHCDTVFYYLLTGGSNTQNITVYVSRGEYKQYLTPTIAMSRGGMSTFIGKYYSHSIIKGDGNNDKSIIVIGDRNGKLFVPWLIPHYENICFINPLFYIGDAEDTLQMISDYNVTDLLILESIPMFGDSKENKRIAEVTGIEVE